MFGIRFANNTVCVLGGGVGSGVDIDSQSRADKYDPQRVRACKTSMQHDIQHRLNEQVLTIMPLFKGKIVTVPLVIVHHSVQICFYICMRVN